MHFRILGPLEVEDGPQSIPLGGHQQRALLALLLLRANEVVPVDEIIEGLWGAESPASATKSVQALVSKLRRRLEGEAADDANGETGENGVLFTRPHGYVLTVADGELDLHRFQSLMEQGRGALAAGQAAEAAERLQAGLALWRGPPLTEFAYDSFAQIEIARLEELRLSGVEERVEAELALGLHRELISELEALVARNPLRERLRGQLSQADRLLTTLSHKAVLARGFALVKDADGAVIKHAAEVASGLALSLEFADGTKGSRT